MALVAAVGFAAGRKVDIQYDGFDEWHVRLFLAQVDGNEWVSATAHFDMYAELFDSTNGDISVIRFQLQDGVLPI